LNVLWFLIALNVLIFIITLLRPEAVIPLLGLTPALLPQHPWTIISSMFVHDPGTWTHIVFNMISLYFLGSLLIRAAGERSFLAIYFLGGVVGNILFALIANPSSTGIGASGAIFALGGALAVMVPRVPVFIFFIPVPVPLWVAIIIFFLFSFLPNIAWQAHLGGLLLGLVAGLILRRRRRTYSV